MWSEGLVGSRESWGYEGKEDGGITVQMVVDVASDTVNLVRATPLVFCVVTVKNLQVFTGEATATRHGMGPLNRTQKENVMMMLP
jgi:hypothetical protein